MNVWGVYQRLAKLEERLARLEARLGVESAKESSPPASLSPVPGGEGQGEGRSEISNLESQISNAPFSPALSPAYRGEGVKPPPPPVPTITRPVVPVHAPGTFEAHVGLKWAGWAGAIIVVIGAALGIKYAYDNNWFGALPPAARLALMSIGGFALIAAGEVVYRRVSAVAAVGPFGAGVATLFVVSYAGYRYFALYEREAAFVLMGLVTLVGAAVAMRGNLVSIAVLAIVGGNVAPLVLHSDVPRLAPLLTYLLMLQAVALVLAAWGHSTKWWTLRGVALATISLWLAVPILAADQLTRGERTTVLTFSLVYAALFHAELVFSSLRGPRVTTSRVPEFAVPVPLGERDGEADLRGLGVTFSLLVTAAVTIALLSLQRDQPPLERGAWTLGLAGCCLALGLMLPKLVQERDPMAPPGAAFGLAIGYRIQAAALLVVAIPVTLSGVWVTVAWAVLAVAFALAGASLNLGVSRVAAVLVWVLAVFHLLIWTLDGALGFGGRVVGTGTHPLTPWADWLGVPIPAYFVMAALIAVVGHAVAALVREDWSPASAAREAPVSPEPVPAGPTVNGATHNLNYETPATRAGPSMAAAPFQSLASLADILAVVAFAVATFAALPPVGTTFALLCYGWALIGAGQTLRAAELHPAGVLLLLIAACKWLAGDTLNSHADYRPLYNPLVAVGTALFLSGLALLRVPLRIGSAAKALGAQRTARAIAGFGSMLVLLWLVTMEIDRYFGVRAYVTAGPDTAELMRTKQVVISVVWSVYAVGCVALGFAIRVAGLRYFGLALFGLTVAKVMLIDLGKVQTGYRILSFLGLGLLLLGTSVLYGKLSPILLREEPPRPADESADPQRVSL